MRPKELLQNKYVRLALGATLGIFVLILIFSPHPGSKTQLAPSPNPALAGLPLHLSSFKTSPGIEVDIDIFRSESDTGNSVHFEVTGLSYANPDSSPFTNPNVTAFKDGYTQGLSLLRTAGVDPATLTFTYSSIPYIQSTAAAWVQKLGLHP